MSDIAWVLLGSNSFAGDDIIGYFYPVLRSACEGSILETALFDRLPAGAIAAPNAEEIIGLLKREAR